MKKVTNGFHNKKPRAEINSSDVTKTIASFTPSPAGVRKHRLSDVASLSDAQK